MERLENRVRLLKLIEVFEKYTDEHHELTLDELIEKLSLEYGATVSVSKKSIKEDINRLMEHGMGIIENQEGEGLPKYYSYQHRKFELYELRMLMDAVSSAHFISLPETKQLIEKIKTLTSHHEAKKLQSELFLDPSKKSENERMRFTIDQLHTAISERSFVTFQYGRYDVNKKFQLSRRGEPFLVQPLKLVWQNAYYYLIGYLMPEKELRHYRLDRMRNLRQTNETYPAETFDLTNYLRKTFMMYSGEEDKIEIQFHNNLINVMIDHFGRDVDIRKVDDEHFVVKTKAHISDGLVKWILTWGAEAKVLAPPQLVEKVKEEVKQLQSLYSPL